MYIDCGSLFNSFKVQLYSQWEIDVSLAKNYNIHRDEILEMPFYEFYYKIKICEKMAEEENERNRAEEAKYASMTDYKNMKTPSLPDVKLPNVSLPSL